jgi:hypothetical protein
LVSHDVLKMNQCVDCIGLVEVHPHLFIIIIIIIITTIIIGVTTITIMITITIFEDLNEDMKTFIYS